MKKHSSISNSPELSRRGTKPMRRESREVMSELVSQLTRQLETDTVVLPIEDKVVPDAEKPNLDRLTVGVDLGDQWSNYCILGLGGETLDGGSVQDESAVDSGVLSRSVPIARGDRSGDAFGVGAGGDRRTWP